MWYFLPKFWKDDLSVITRKDVISFSEINTVILWMENETRSSLNKYIVILFFLQIVKKDGFSKKNWSFLYYRQRWYSSFPKVWSYRRKMKDHISQKKYMEISFFKLVPPHQLEQQRIWQKVGDDLSVPCWISTLNSGACQSF